MSLGRANYGFRIVNPNVTRLGRPEIDATHAIVMSYLMPWQ